jgi:uncharacterized membrane protein
MRASTNFSNAVRSGPRWCSFCSQRQAGVVRFHAEDPLKYTCEIVIARPRDEVISKFDSLENLSKWQPTLKSAEPLSGEPGQAGSTMRMVYVEGKREMVMNETITANNFPESFDATYTAPGVVNPCHNIFKDLGDGETQWTMESEFTFSGFMALMSRFMRKAFPRETLASMEKFKAWIEST